MTIRSDLDPGVTGQCCVRGGDLAAEAGLLTIRDIGRSRFDDVRPDFVDYRRNSLARSKFMHVPFAADKHLDSRLAGQFSGNDLRTQSNTDNSRNLEEPFLGPLLCMEIIPLFKSHRAAPVYALSQEVYHTPGQGAIGLRRLVVSM